MESCFLPKPEPYSSTAEPTGFGGPAFPLAAVQLCQPLWACEAGQEVFKSAFPVTSQKPPYAQVHLLVAAERQVWRFQKQEFEKEHALLGTEHCM